MNRSISTLYQESERFIIKPYSLQYAENMFRELTPIVCKYLRIGPAKHIDETKSFIQDSMCKVENQETAQVIITDKNGVFIGQIGALDLKTATPELGFRFKESARGQGYGTASMHALINRAVANIEFDYLRYIVAKENKGSRRVAEKLGFELQVDTEGKEFVFHEITRVPGKILESVEYRLYKKS